MMHSPLRYPGGKSDFLAIARAVVEGAGLTGRHIVEPYAGSAAVSLGLLDLGLTSRVTLLERDPLLFSFWKALFTRTDEFLVGFQDLPITLETWHKLRPCLRVEAPNDSNVVELGLAGLFFNRTNFSGILNAGPIGGLSQRSQYKIDCRTNKDEIISRLLALVMFADSVDVIFGDAVDLVRRWSGRKDLLFYLDPPYFNKGDLLYRHYYGLRQHKELAAALSGAKFKWLLSYDDHHVIEFLYRDCFVRKLDFRYSARKAVQRTELLISNFKTPLVADVGEPIPRRQRSQMPSQARTSRVEGLEQPAL